MYVYQHANLRAPSHYLEVRTLLTSPVFYTLLVVSGRERAPVVLPLDQQFEQINERKYGIVKYQNNLLQLSHFVCLCDAQYLKYKIKIFANKTIFTK